MAEPVWIAKCAVCGEYFTIDIESKKNICPNCGWIRGNNNYVKVYRFNR